ncbi:hypothetical protein [Pantoea sp. At-9b]|jgi:hypothetical protein|uniref:hypothetical protein n=1 Tax=Pantoea sp. (strain At-9b) TaxID=592316 RepID=UPI0001F25FD7|nr:hypothetical protein [Pantoea sp. At-9b]ADU72349.1 hypothetical protein Pat9b_5079 [Pantoea sp. At-9b]
MSTDPLKTNVSDGLVKMHEAAELIPEEKIAELAEKAKKDAEEFMQQRREHDRKSDN